MLERCHIKKNRCVLLGKEAQTQYDYKTGATQVLFLQNVLKSMKKDSVCGIVMDEGVLFRTNEAGFVQTKRKLLEECNVWCIVSLPGERSRPPGPV